MKTFFAILLIFVLVTAKAQVPVPPPATAAQVTAGTSTYSFISPATLQGANLVSDKASAFQDITSFGLAGNLIDYVSFCSGEGMTNQTWAGAPVTYNGNVLFSRLGATLTGNGGGAGGQILFSILNGGLPPSNSIAITWYAVRTNAGTFFGTMFQAVNTNNLDSINCILNTAVSGGGAEGFFMLYDAQNTAIWPNSYPAGFTNLLQYYWGGTYTYEWDLTIRHVTIVSQDGLGNVSCWDDGITNSWYAAGSTVATPLNFPIHPTTALNLMSIGAPFSTNGIYGVRSDYTNFSNFTIQSISLWNTTPQSQSTAANGVNQLVQAANWVSDWIQPATEKDLEDGDSRMFGNSLTNNPGTRLASWLFPNAIIYEHFQGGERLQDTGPITNLISLNLPHGKVKNLRIWEQKGINDINGSGLTASQCEGLLTNNFFNPIAGVFGASLNVLGVWQAWTNSGAGDGEIAANLAQKRNYNWFCATNKAVVSIYGDPFTLVNQNFMDSNRVGAASLEGLHFNNPTNGNAAYDMIYGEWYRQIYGSNPFIVPYLTPQTFPFPATTVNWTNIFPSAVQVFIDNNGVTGTSIKRNGVQYYAGTTTLPSLVLPLNPGEYFSETYTVGTPVGSWMIKE